MPHRSTLRGRVWKLPDLWTQRTRPQILAKPQNGFAQASTRLIAVPFQKNPKPELLLFQWSATHRFCGGGENPMVRINTRRSSTVQLGTDCIVPSHPHKTITFKNTT